MTLLHTQSLAATLDAVNEAFFFGGRLIAAPAGAVVGLLERLLNVIA